ncbi:hypothetical protein [Chitinivorax sp. B]|uniref:BufA2 family periplasmic bufferin-type metallophore n=1 Tax=Chitinivorax sp. B TaxID=2502235 RepID=UPI0010F6DC63|nr:hypothetical protein [Chitinivorax sp. B]
MKIKATRVALASAAALMFGAIAVPGAHAADEAKVKCEGINGCKGQSACKTAKNDCKGLNSCKGQGWVEASKQECDAAQAAVKGAQK